jgi:hypothetical protein
MVSDISLYDESTPFDSAALLPFVGAPFAYHTFRSGRSNWPTTVASLGIGFGLTNAAFRIAGRRAGFTSTEWALGQILGAIGVRVGGRHYLMAMLHPEASGLGWRVPLWVNALMMYEFTLWYDDKYFGYWESQTSGSIKGSQREQFY